eukprot:scaffold301252_cov21-Tisochrysis_lutea.AAC.1
MPTMGFVCAFRLVCTVCCCCCSYMGCSISAMQSFCDAVLSCMLTASGLSVCLFLWRLQHHHPD